jgi:hypothetical protein
VTQGLSLLDWCLLRLHSPVTLSYSCARTFLWHSLLSATNRLTVTQHSKLVTKYCIQASSLWLIFIIQEH